mgnify:CR=1 FL=1
MTGLAAESAADIGGEALWDLVTLWTLLAAAVLLLPDRSGWPYFGRLAGAVYLSSAGRGVITIVASITSLTGS